MKRRTALPFVVAGLFVSAACSVQSRPSLAIPTTPTVSVPRALPGAPPNATPISVGQEVRATVTAFDTPCEFSWGPEPCVEFSIVPSTSGSLWVRLSSAGPSELGLRIAAEVAGYDVNRIERSALVSAGSTYAVRVSLHFARDGNTNQAFALTSGIEP